MYFSIFFYYHLIPHCQMVDENGFVMDDDEFCEEKKLTHDHIPCQIVFISTTIMPNRY